MTHAKPLRHRPFALFPLLPMLTLHIHDAGTNALAEALNQPRFKATGARSKMRASSINSDDGRLDTSASADPIHAPGTRVIGRHATVAAAEPEAANSASPQMPIHAPGSRVVGRHAAPRLASQAPQWAETAESSSPSVPLHAPGTRAVGRHAATRPTAEAPQRPQSTMAPGTSKPIVDPRPVLRAASVEPPQEG